MKIRPSGRIQVGKLRRRSHHTVRHRFHRGNAIGPSTRARASEPAGGTRPAACSTAALLGVFPTLLLGFSVFHSEGERILGMNGLLFGALLILAGFVAYWAASSNGVNARLAAAPPDAPDS